MDDTMIIKKIFPNKFFKNISKCYAFALNFKDNFQLSKKIKTLLKITPLSQHIYTRNPLRIYNGNIGAGIFNR